MMNFIHKILVIASIINTKISISRFLFIIGLTTAIIILDANNATAKKDKEDTKDFIRISDLNDLNAGTWSGESGDIELIDDLCIYSTTGTYKITAEGSEPSGKFSIYNSDDDKKKIDFKLYWNDEAQTNFGEIELKTNRTSITQTTSETQKQTCAGGNDLTARVRVVFDYDDLVSSRAGMYNGTITLTVELD